MADEQLDVNTSKLNSWIGAALLGICGWNLLTTLQNTERTTRIEASAQYFVQTVNDIKLEMKERVTRNELELLATKIKNEQLTFQNELLKQQQKPTAGR